MSAATLPWTIEEARDALHAASRLQSEHQETIRDAFKAHARARHLHRVALARKIAELRDAGTAAAVCSKLAAGDSAVSVLEEEADRLDGDRELAVQEGWRRHANRKDTQELADWSKRRELAEGYGQVLEPVEFENVTPARAA